MAIYVSLLSIESTKIGPQTSKELNFVKFYLG